MTDVSVEALISQLYQGAWSDAPKGRRFGNMILVSTPEGAADLLADPKTFAKEYGLLTMLGESRFDAHGANWKARRDLTQPAYREGGRAGAGSWIAQTYEAYLRGLPYGPATNLEHALLGAAGEIFARAIGTTVPGNEFANWIVHSRDAARQAQTVSMFGTDEAGLCALRVRAADMRKRADALLAGNATLGAFRDDLVARMACTAEHDPFDPLGEIAFALLGGIETTVASTLWALWALARHPSDQERIASDVAGEGTNAASLAILVQETLRYWPPVPLLTRRVREDGARLAGKSVPRGTLLALDLIGLHHDRAYWDEPATFIPDRSEFRNRTWRRWAYLPFSAGPRVCGGIGLARLEIHAAVASILSRFRLSVPVDAPAGFDYALTLRPSHPGSIVLERRADG